jgi:hypothetical protein
MPKTRMPLENRKFWSADSFKEVFCKTSQYHTNEIEKYLRDTYRSYKRLWQEIRARQPNAKKLLDYGAGFGIGWMLGTMEGYEVYCADIGNLLDFCPARHKYSLPRDMNKIKRIKWDAIFLKGVLSYIPQEDLENFIDSLLKLDTKGLYLMGWMEGNPRCILNRRGIKGHIYQQKRIIPILKSKNFKIVDTVHPFAVFTK